MTRIIKRRERTKPSPVTIWEVLPLETQLSLIQAGLVDPERIGVDRAPPIPKLVLFETRAELERLMKETPRYTIFQPSLRGLRSPKVSFQDPAGRNDRASHRQL